MAIGTRLGLGPRDRDIIIKDSLPEDGAKLPGHADPTNSEGSIHTTRDGAKEMEALLRSRIHPSSVCACLVDRRPVAAEGMIGLLGAVRRARGWQTGIENTTKQQTKNFSRTDDGSYAL
jgi:hypothetical protein